MGQAPAISTFCLVEARYRAALARFNNLPTELETSDPDQYGLEEVAFHATWLEALAEPANTAEEFVLSFLVAFDDGTCLAHEDVFERLVADALKLAGRA